jgi:acetyl-CoA carboxylase biotin carboxylase subunit
MFSKLLIANRGEIAVRIIRACRDMQISPVAIYSEADRAALHVRLADEAYLVGPPPSSESYLAIGRIVEAARRCQADAIHPGYGFLAENPAFARACADIGIPMVGPSADSIQLMGNKTEARAALLSFGVPLIPGMHRPLKSKEEAVAQAAGIGYPLMIKAAAGGGGMGMRLVEEEAAMPAAYEAASSEALRAFGDPAIYLEKCLRPARHIEVQVLADRYGNAVHLGERECSLQRRHQKLLEECPSSFVDPDLRRRMGEAALNVVRAARYENAGTVEFLVDEQKKFYFLEMNTRLQVEHPVTELVTGLDIVREQLRIACGEPLGLRQEELRMQGWAIECRIYAEDPENSFLPSPGRIRNLVEPQGPGVRVDSGVYDGWEIPVHYDPLIAKVIAWGADREQAAAKMRRAVREYRIQGLKTNLRFFADLLEDREWVEGRLSTGFVDSFLARCKAVEAPQRPLSDALALAAAIAHGDSVRGEAVGRDRETESSWKMAGRLELLHNAPRGGYWRRG